MKIYLAMVQVTVIAIISLYAFSSEALKVKNASDAMDVALSCLRKQNPQTAPDTDIRWKERIIFSDEPVDLVTTSKQFTSDAWIVEVSQGLAPLRNIVYQVIVFDTKLGWYWKGSIKADGSVHEESAFGRLSDEERHGMTEELLRKSRISAPIGGYGH
jgi:hypothetical protein